MSTASPDTLTSPLTLTSPTSISNRPNAASFLQAPGTSGSSTSLADSSRTGTKPSQDPLLRTRKQLGQAAALRPNAHQHKSETDRTDALWTEMQATLAEVELSASRGTHFFGPAHATALEELRQAQIALAQAWARGEGEGEIVEGWQGEGGRSEDSSQKSPTASASEDGRGRQEEAERDLLVAKRRKEANDRYFERVGRGVVDVVGRLEEVAVAMGKVERESREVWSETESMESAALTDESVR
ncbi:MAG: hypothetical protein MMC23_009295 [Stictis urceolatum]|nr:hypothetical protein [Stictis urceolata]